MGKCIKLCEQGRVPMKKIIWCGIGVIAVIGIIIGIALSSKGSNAMALFEKMDAFAFLSNENCNYDELCTIFERKMDVFAELKPPYLIVSPEKMEGGGWKLRFYEDSGNIKDTANAEEIRTIVVKYDIMVDTAKYYANGNQNGTKMQGVRFATRLYYYDMKTAAFVAYDFIDTAEKLKTSYSGKPGERVKKEDVITTVNKRMSSWWQTEYGNAFTANLKAEQLHSGDNGAGYNYKQGEIFQKGVTESYENRRVIYEGNKINSFVVDGDWIFYLEAGKGIGKIKTDGSENTLILDYSSILKSLYFYKGWLYYTDFGGEITQMDPNGGESKKLTTNGLLCGVVNDTMFYEQLSFGDKRPAIMDIPVKSISLDGDTSSKYATNVVFATYDMNASDRNALYARLFQYNAPGKASETVNARVSIKDQVCTYKLSGDMLYYITNEWYDSEHRTELYSVSLDTFENKHIAPLTGLGEINRADDEWVYFTEGYRVSIATGIQEDWK